jgi:uncharacterized protein (TIGR01777 family)
LRVFVTGATGFVGRPLVAALLARGDSVVALSRSASAAARLGPRVEVLIGDPTVAGAWMEALAGCDGAVNLAGESLMVRRWSAEQKRRIRDSRVLTTRNLVQALRAAGRGAPLVSASAIGYYGPRGDDPVDESAEAGDGFLAEVCAAWEREAEALAGETRVARVRIGLVLGRGGGALPRLTTPFRLFAGGPVGTGRQWVSWIHLDDVVGLLQFALDDARVEGAMNASAPGPVTMRELARTLGRALNRPAWLPVPGLAVRLALGEAAETVLTGQRVLPVRAQRLGYRFKFERLDDALADLVGKGAAQERSALPARRRARPA